MGTMKEAHQELVKRLREQHLNSGEAQAWQRKTGEEKSREVIDTMTKDNLDWHQRRGVEISEDKARQQAVKAARDVERTRK